MIPRYAVVTTFNRPDIALDCIRSISLQADTVFVIDNGDEKPMPPPVVSGSLAPYYVHPVDMQPVNLSALWNIGIRLAAQDAARMGSVEWDVAIFNDDCIVPGNWFERVQSEMRSTTAVAACSGPTRTFLQEPGIVAFSTRMTGWAFMLRGETELLADERFEWWCGDTDLDWRTRQAGGMLMVPIGYVENRFPNGLTTGYRAERVATDMENFVAKWQMRPF